MSETIHVSAGNEWWRNAVVYQVYPRSFADANGDGTGDVEGIRSRIPYLAKLGIDAVWMNPWYPSPLLDGGYRDQWSRPLPEGDHGCGGGHR